MRPAASGGTQLVRQDFAPPRRLADRHLHLLWPGPSLGNLEDGAGGRGDPDALTLDDIAPGQEPSARMEAHAGKGRKVTSLARHRQVHGVGDDVGEVVQRERTLVGDHRRLAPQGEPDGHHRLMGDDG